MNAMRFPQLPVILNAPHYHFEYPHGHFERGEKSSPPPKPDQDPSLDKSRRDDTAEPSDRDKSLEFKSKTRNPESKISSTRALRKFGKELFQMPGSICRGNMVEFQRFDSK